MIMNTNDKNKTNGAPKTSIAHACGQTCRRLVEGIELARAAILSEFRDRLEEHQHVLELAVNEAEALAWQTGFPQLVFPTLAKEKAQTAERWHAHQRVLLPIDSPQTFHA